LAVRAVGVDDRGDLAVRVDLQVFGRELLAVRTDVDLVDVVRQGAFLQHDGDLASVGRAPRIEFDHVEMAFDGSDWPRDSSGSRSVEEAAGRFPHSAARTRLLHTPRKHGAPYAHRVGA